MFAVALALFSFAAVAPPEQPFREFIVATQPTNFLSASSVRLVPGKWTIDNTTGKPLLSASLEAYGDDVADDGTTNKSVLRRQELTLTTTQLTTWNSQTGTNGWNWLRASILAKTKLTAKP